MYRKITFHDDTTVIVKAPKCVMQHKSPEDEFVRWVTRNLDNVKRIEKTKKPKCVLQLELHPRKGVAFNIFAPMDGNKPLAQTCKALEQWLKCYASDVEMYALIEAPTQKEVQTWLPLTI